MKNMYDVTIFGINLTIDPVAFRLPIGENGWTVYWYGIIIAIGFVLAIVYGYFNAKRFGIDVDRMLDVVLITTIPAILGARAYYVIFDPNGKINNIKEFFGFGGSGFSGLAIYGGVITAVVVGCLAAKIRKVKILDILDLAAIAFLIGQGIGRWGNFVNQEAYGGFTGSTWWGMTSNKTTIEMGSNALVHPCFLYESIWCLLGVLVLHLLSRKRNFSGEVALMYCVWYGFGRALIEITRTDSLMIGNAKVSLLLSAALCISGIVGIMVVRTKKKKAVFATTYESMFRDEIEEDSVTVEEQESAQEE